MSTNSLMPPRPTAYHNCAGLALHDVALVYGALYYIFIFDAVRGRRAVADRSRMVSPSCDCTKGGVSSKRLGISSESAAAHELMCTQLSTGARSLDIFDSPLRTARLFILGVPALRSNPRRWGTRSLHRGTLSRMLREIRIVVGLRIAETATWKTRYRICI